MHKAIAKFDASTVDEKLLGSLETDIFLLLDALRHNTQVDDFVVTFDAPCFEATCAVHAPHAVREAFNSEPVERALTRLRQVYGIQPRWTLPGSPVNEAPPRAPASALILHADALSRESPLIDANTGAPVSLYPLALPAELLDNLLRWSTEARALDELWLGSGPLERAAYEQLVRHDRAHVLHGRDLAAQLEGVTGVPVFCGIPPVFRFDHDEAVPVCPACGEPFVDHPADPDTNLSPPFPRRCGPCHIAYTWQNDDSVGG